jgi:hypothetical protein
MRKLKIVVDRINHPVKQSWINKLRFSGGIIERLLLRKITLGQLKYHRA